MRANKVFVPHHDVAYVLTCAPANVRAYVLICVCMVTCVYVSRLQIENIADDDTATRQ